TARKAGAVFGTSTQASDSGRRGCDPRKRPAAHTPGTPAQEGVPTGGHKRLVYLGSAGRGERREHGVVCLLLARVACLSARAFYQGMVPVASAVLIASRRKLDSTPAADGAVAWRAQQSNEASARHIAAGSARRAAGCSGQGAKRRPARLLAGVRSD